MELKEIASISGKEGLYRILKPARVGVIVESLDGQKRKMTVGISQKVSILKEISIYTITNEGCIPLEEVFYKMHEKYQGSLPIDSKASSADLMAFINDILPEYDSNRVYPSDVKKIIKWYEILKQQAPQVLERPQELDTSSENTLSKNNEHSPIETEPETILQDNAASVESEQTNTPEPSSKKRRSSKKAKQSQEGQEIEATATEKPKKKSTKTKKEA